MNAKIITGDSLQVLKTLEDESINCVITSPPYYGLRDYGTAGQIGLEQTPEEYIEKMVELFREVRRVLKAGGTLWLNIGDSYAGGAGRWGGNKNMSEKQNSNRGSLGQIPEMRKWIHDEIKTKDLIGIPWMLAFALRADGWYLRQDIIWHKPNAMPESVKDRCTKSHEYIFLLSKSPKYYYDHVAIKEPCSEANIKDFQRRKTMDNKGSGKGTYEEARPDLSRSREAYMPKDFKRNKRDVWTIPTKPFKGAHFATFPEALVEPCLLAGCPEGGTALDPFAGAGTVGVVCKKNNRNFIGIELNPEYAAMAETRINNTQP